jgi:outer membrane protein TolC
LLFEKQSLLQEEIAIAGESVARTRILYVNGQEPYLTVLAALLELQTLQQEEITLRQEMLINRSRLLKALSAGWSHHHESP